MRSSLFFDIFYGFQDIRIQRIAKIIPQSKLGGNNGPIVLVRGGSRFDANCNIHRYFHIQVVRYPLTNLFAQTDTHTHVKLKTSFLGVQC